MEKSASVYSLSTARILSLLFGSKPGCRTASPPHRHSGACLKELDLQETIPQIESGLSEEEDSCR